MPGPILFQPGYSCTNSSPFYHFMSKWMQQLSLFAIKRLSSRGRWQGVGSSEMGAAGRGKMCWTSSCLEGGKKSPLSLSNLQGSCGMSPQTPLRELNFISHESAITIQPGSTIPGKTLMQGVQATLKLFRALWEQHFFVGHF